METCDDDFVVAAKDFIKRASDELDYDAVGRAAEAYRKQKC